MLVGRSERGDLCGPCSGTDIDFACRRCHFPGNVYADGLCVRCVVSDCVNDLLSDADDTDGTLVPQPQPRPLAEQLAQASQPHSIRLWLRRSASARLLASSPRRGPKSPTRRWSVCPRTAAAAMSANFRSPPGYCPAARSTSPACSSYSMRSSRSCRRTRPGSSDRSPNGASCATPAAGPDAAATPFTHRTPTGRTSESPSSSSTGCRPTGSASTPWHTTISTSG